MARRYVAFLPKSIRVYHRGDHTCPAKPVVQKPVREIKRQLTENPQLTPSTIQSNLIVSQMRQGKDWNSIEETARNIMDKKWLSNQKQKIKDSNQPHGHNFEAVAHFKQYADQRDPYYVYTMNDRRENPSKPSHVFKSSKLKAQFALNMDCATSENKLSDEFCFFDGKVK
ncbi:Hypothetical predicted protein [Paramuricea clavata]|uniref:Uncharacterized protein n=1 Tax=Paramuricea clavata TaxID=317549 RepID=A0A6S7KFF9_PARCT|nr:Hypothetical predicted protein [Paramuricea clavata]